MLLTTVGTGTAAPAADRVQAGHLVVGGEVRLLLDCGSGVAHRLAALGIDWMGITHVALTHFHADHVLDLSTLLIAWRYGAMGARAAPLELIGPPGTAARLEALGALFGDVVNRPEFPFTTRELSPGGVLDLVGGGGGGGGGGVRLEGYKVPHTPESMAYCVEHGGRRLVYTGDTGPDAGLGAWARGCDVLLAECSLPEELAIPTHLTPRRCAELAEAAAPGRLVLTHFYPPVKVTDVRATVAERYAGEVVLAHDGWSTEIEDT